MIELQTINLDCFAGGGGASLGMTRAGYAPNIAINHDPEAISVHAANHPHCEHICQDVFEAKPCDVVKGRRIKVAWFSPDCTHHSKAKGCKPLDGKRRSLAWVVVDYALLPEDQRPEVIFLENVEEWRHWGPLDDANRPIKSRRGETFEEWCAALRALGYVIGWFELRAADYGAPTTRNRLYLVARRDGQPINRPIRTHSPKGIGGFEPWHTAAEIIDWSIPCPSIFMTREEAKAYHAATGIRVNRPLKPKTMARIAKGVKRFVIDAAEPFIIPITHAGEAFRGHGIDDPIRTVTTAHRGEMAIVTPFVSKFNGDRIGSSFEEPLHTVMAGTPRHAVVAPFFARTAHGDVDKKGKRRGKGEHSIEEPFPTVTRYQDSALVSAFLAQHNNNRGVDPNAGRQAELPLSSVTTKAQQGVIAAHLLSMRSDGRHRSPDDPVFTITGQGLHVAEVRAFLMKYHHSGGQHQSLFDPLHTVDAKPRFGLVTVHGVDYEIVDIGMRMLTPRELARGQGFPDDYIFHPIVNGKPLSNTSAVAKIGNSVSPFPAEALIRANMGGAPMESPLWEEDVAA